jgi:hypothetical protein
MRVLLRRYGKGWCACALSATFSNFVILMNGFVGCGVAGSGTAGMTKDEQIMGLA